MKQPKVFIASSSEGLEVARTVRSLLLLELRDSVEVNPWTREFELSATYIESLERAADEADFAVVVVTPDDVTTSRDRKKPAPRDNVVFELGLFMGSLGRERCFIVNEDTPNMKIPSDLFGVHFASFKKSADLDPKVALAAQCVLISERIAKLGIRYRLSKETLASQAAVRRFCESVEGTWWERVTRDDTHALSFFRIESDPLFNTVSLGGRSYDKEGAYVARWNSLLGRVNKDENKILYHWTGWHSNAALANVTFHGFGEMEFDKPLKSGDPFSRGAGKFWNVDEAHPENTIVKPMQLRRVQESGSISTMTGGNEKKIRALIVKTLLEW